MVANASGLETGRVPFSEKNQLAYLPANLLMIQAWNILPDVSWNIPAWSISAEFGAYVLFAILCTLLKRRALGVLVALGLASGALLVITSPYGPMATYDLGLARCMFGFATGALINAAWRWRPDLRLPFASALESAAVILTVVVVSMLPHVLGILVVPVFALTVWIFAHEQGVVSQLLRGKAGRFLGDRSYSIYMVHFLIAVVMLSLAAIAPAFGFDLIRLGVAHGENTGLVGPAWLMDVVLIVFLALTVIVASVTYMLVEVPTRTMPARLAKAVAARQTGPGPCLIIRTAPSRQAADFSRTCRSRASWLRSSSCTAISSSKPEIWG